MLTSKIAKKLTKSAILVYLFIQESGEQPVGIISDALGISIASVYTALKEIKKIRHEIMINHGSSKDRTVEKTGAPVSKSARTSDPLLSELVDLGMWEGAAKAILKERTDRERLVEQLAWHRHRLEAGYKFRDDCPARLLTYLLRNPEKDATPAGFYEARQPVNPSAPVNRSGPTAAPVSPVSPVEDAPAPMTREGALSAIRLGINSKLPFMRAEAERLAAEWGVNLASLRDHDHRAIC